MRGRTCRRLTHAVAAVTNGRYGDIVVFGGPAAVSSPILTGIGDVTFGPNAWATFANRVAPPRL